MTIFLEKKAFASKINECNDEILNKKSRLLETYIIYDPHKNKWWVRMVVNEEGGYLDYDQEYILAFDRTKNKKTNSHIEGFVSFLKDCGVKRIVIDIPSE
jgi:hypothetical protein